MSTKNQSEIVRNMDKQALFIYGVLAALVYACALAYCYFTDHFFEMGLIGGVMLVLGILIVNVYASTGSEAKKEHETENYYKNVA